MGEKGNQSPLRWLFGVDNNERNRTDVNCSEVRHIGQASGYRWVIGCGNLHDLMIRVAEDPFTPASILADMAASEDVEIRLSVAENPSTPAMILELLALDDNADIRYSMAENPNIPVNILRILTMDENPYVECRAESTIARIYNQHFAQAS